MSAAKTLTCKQDEFVRHYLVDLNATAAYRRAGYGARGNSAEVNAARLL
jgi:phage terminase small subunit